MGEILILYLRKARFQDFKRDTDPLPEKSKISRFQDFKRDTDPLPEKSKISRFQDFKISRVSF